MARPLWYIPLEATSLKAPLIFFAPAVLGLPHRAVDTRDVALYQVCLHFYTLTSESQANQPCIASQPFRNTLQNSNPHQIIGLQTLSWQLMARRCQEGQIHPVSFNLRSLQLEMKHGAHIKFLSSALRGAGRERPCRSGSLPICGRRMGGLHLSRKLAVRSSPKYLLSLLPLTFLPIFCLPPIPTSILVASVLIRVFSLRSNPGV